MKKFLVSLLVLLICVGCSSNKETPKYTYDIKTKQVDMSGYEGVNSTQHKFVGVTVQELFNCIDEKSSGVFYLGRTNCGCCQTCVQYLNRVATELDMTIYYIDVYDPDMPLTDTELCDKLREYIYDILDEVDGQKELQTPTVFNVINGKLTDSIICLANSTWDNPPTQAQENKLMNKYKEILKPFVE